jgi:hypothetical protein
MITTKYRRSCVDAYKLSHGCCACGYNKHPSVLSFDHLVSEDKHPACRSGSRPGGMFQLYAKKYDTSVLIDEIKKCRILCCNCHMEYTYTHHVFDDNSVKTKPMTLEELEYKLNEVNHEHTV